MASPALAPPRGPGGVYLHFPFCASRCSYCDFATVVGRDAEIEGYLDALRCEIAVGQPEFHGPIDTIYLGGGTPSRMSPAQLEGVLEAVHERFELLPGSEVSIECNPESLDPQRLRAYATAGVTRVSIGVQSLDDDVLASVHRPHDGRIALQAVEVARAVPTLQVGVDLIAGLPGDEPRSWLAGLSRLLEREPDHLSFYLLETDKDAPLARAIRSGRVSTPDDDRLADLYQQAVDLLGATGFQPYEISNFAREGRVSRHNLKYWTDLPYAGFGLGAHAYHAGARRGNLRDLDAYLQAVREQRDPVVERDPWNRERRVEEAMILGLRLHRGLDLVALGKRYGLDLERRHEATWRQAEEQGLLERKGTVARLTDRGRLLSNTVFVQLLSDA